MSRTPQDKAKASIEHGDSYPYDDANRYSDDAEVTPARDWAHRAARGILADLTDRRGVKHELEDIDDDVRVELVESLAEIIRQADAERQNVSSKIEVDDTELEIARQAIEAELIWRRDNHIFQIRNNGLCVKEADGTPNPLIRMGAETAIAIGLKAINNHRGV